MMRSLLFWVLLPFVIFQAVRIRKTAPRVVGAGGPNVGIAGAGQSYNLVAIGDSIISGVGATKLVDALVGQTAQQLSDLLNCRIDWAAYGSIGARSDKVLNRLLPKLPPEKVDFLVLSVGVNDITSLSRVSMWLRNLTAILTALRQHSPNAIVAVLGIPPLRGFPLLPQPLRALFGIRGETFDIVCRRVVSCFPLAIHVPMKFEPHPDRFSPDGFHPSQESYREFGRVTAEHIAAEVNDGRVGSV